jgi:CubicO group peptidase (beta-lactamase class C family)
VHPFGSSYARRGFAVVALLGGLSLSALGQTGAPADSARRRGPTDPAELESFVDGLMTAQLTDKHVAGAIVAVVRDGAVLFTRGYGYANVAKRTRVDPDRTLFRVGSIGKLFTWTAVMQQVEAGKLDLDTDLNTYLDFTIPATYPEPITLRHAMSHTPGFEEDSRDLFTNDSTGIVPLGQWLATHIPERVRPPGTYSAYSNYATALAGYVVARVSGIPYEEYVEQRILQPLGMRRTTARQPLPAPLAPDMSEGYRYQGGTFEPRPFELVAAATPAGSISSTAADMAQFMLAHLSRGALGDQRILAESTATAMQTRGFVHDPRLPGWGLGFYEKSSHGLRIIGHGGDTQWFHSDLALIPSENLGVFVSYNTDTGGGLSYGPFLNAFLDHYYPDPAPIATYPADATAQADKIVGEYEGNRRSYSTFQKAFGLAGATRITADSAGALIFDGGSGLSRWVPVGPFLYREEMGHDLVAFKTDDAGRVTHGFVGSGPMVALERISWYQSPRLYQILLGIALLVFVGVLVAGVRRWFRRRLGRPLPGDELPGRGWLLGLALVDTAFVIAIVVLAGDFWALFVGPATGLKVALALPVIGAVLTVAAVVTTIRHWNRRSGTAGARLRYTGVVLVSVLFIWSINYWNLLGWKL